VERAQEQFNEEEARKLQKRIQKDQFDFNDFLAQLQQIKKMGNMKDLVGMIPGMGKAVKMWISKTMLSNILKQLFTP
jgi:signal recognition particle subunit SRP54